MIANHILIDAGSGGAADTPVVFLHQFRNALFHLLIEGYKRESFALMGLFAVKTIGPDEALLKNGQNGVSKTGKSEAEKSESKPEVESESAPDSKSDLKPESDVESDSKRKTKSDPKSEFFRVRDDLIRTFFEAVMDQKLTLEEFLQLFSTHLFELDANVATLVLQKNIDLISKCYSESELVFLS